jgi:hypothetical protein
MNVERNDAEHVQGLHEELGRHLKQLRSALEQAGYTDAALAHIAKGRDSGEPLDLEVARRQTAAPTAFNVLARLFFLHDIVPRTAAAAALAAVQLDALVHGGLLLPSTGGIRANAMLIPFQDLFILSDFSPQMHRQALRDDHVLSVGAASLTLANLTPRSPVDAVLDVGTGSGIQALLASRHATRVIGTDTNPRALHLAKLNASLNGMSNVEFRQGSLYDPVADCQFDLIIANPPFVISPESRYLYRDSGLPGDTISERVIREAPVRLRVGGYGVVLFNWHHRSEEDWAERPQQWVTSSGCDAWIIRFETSDPLTYAANWLRPTEGRDRERYAQLLDRWVRSYEDMGIGAFSAGAAILRRRAGRNWVRTDTVPGGRRVGSCGEQIERIFAAQDALEELGDDGRLLDWSLALASDHELKYDLRAENGGWSVKAAYLKQTHGFEFTGEVDRWVGSVLARCDGTHALRDLVGDLARDVGMDYEQLVSPCLAVVRRLMQFGFLSVSGRGAATP